MAFLNTVFASGCILFLLVAVDDCIVWIYHHLFIHSAADRPLGGFQVGFMKTAAMNIHVHIFWWTYVCIFQMLSPSYILGINHTFRDVLCYLYVAGSDVLELALGSLHLCDRKKFVWKFPFLSCPCEGLVLGFPRYSKGVGKCSFFPSFWMSLFNMCWSYFFLEYLEELNVGAIWVWDFFLKMV